MATASHDQSVRIWSLGDPVITERVIDAGADALWTMANPDTSVALGDSCNGVMLRAFDGIRWTTGRSAPIPVVSS